MTPIVGITIAAYNAESFLARAINSVLAQTVPRWQLVVVDDGSIDSTYEIAQSYAARDSRIIAISQPNAGTAAARNAGMAHMSTLYQAYLDADDELTPNYLAFMAQFVEENPGFDIYGCNLLRIYSQKLPDLLYKKGVPRQINFEDIIGHWQMGVSGAWVTTQLMSDSGGYSSSFYNEDAYFVFSALAKGFRVMQSPELLYIHYKNHDKNKSSDFLRQANCEIEIARALIASGELNQEKIDVMDNYAQYFERIIANHKGYLEHMKRIAPFVVLSETLQVRLNSAFGKKYGEITWRAIHSFAFIARPIRSLLIKFDITPKSKPIK